MADARVDARDDLVQALRAAGRNVEGSPSDTVLLLHAVEQWEDRCVARIDGDFAFAAWDEDSQRLVAATDRFGVRPLYYAPVRDGLLVSNSAPLLYAHPAQQRRANVHAVADFLVYGELRPGETAFEDLRVLPPAHLIVWERGALRVSRYWSPPVHVEYGASTGDRPDAFLDLLRRAVIDRMRGRPTAVFMSGGLDSTMVAATASEAPSGAALVRAFSVAYRDLIPHDELRFAQSVARMHRFPLTVHFADHHVPFEDATELGMRHPVPVNEPFPAIEGELFHAAAEHGSIVLTGHGTDAILADEPLLPLLEQKVVTPAWATRELLLYLGRYRRHPPLGLRRREAAAPAAIPSWLTTDAVQWLRPPDDPPDAAPAARSHSHRMLHQLSRGGLPASYTAYAADFDLTCAHPLLDRRVVEFCLGLPPVPWCWDKHLMRAAMRGHLPSNVRRRRKTPFAANRLHAVSHRLGTEWLTAVRPGPETRRFFRPDSFGSLAQFVTADPAWVNTRPLALEYFFRWWSSRPVLP